MRYVLSVSSWRLISYASCKQQQQQNCGIYFDCDVSWIESHFHFPCVFVTGNVCSPVIVCHKWLTTVFVPASAGCLFVCRVFVRPQGVLSSAGCLFVYRVFVHLQGVSSAGCLFVCRVFVREQVFVHPEAWPCAKDGMLTSSTKPSNHSWTVQIGGPVKTVGILRQSQTVVLLQKLMILALTVPLTYRKTKCPEKM